MSEPFIGQVEIFAGNFAPRNWAFCYGQLLQIAQHTALFSLLGTTYGGDGRTTFGLPDLRGRAIVGSGTGPGLTPKQLGQKWGSEEETLSVTQMTAHKHTVETNAGELGASDAAADQHEPSPTSVLAAASVQGNPLSMYSTQPSDTDIEGAQLNLALGQTGAGVPHTNMQPYLAMNYIIALQGMYPSRN